MATDKRELILSVKGKDDGASRVLKDVGDAADDAGDDLRGMNKGLTALDSKIADTTKTLSGLRTEIARTGDLDLFKDVAKQEQRLKALARQRMSLIGFDDGEANKQGIRWGAKIAEGIGTGLSTAGGPITRALGNVFGTLPPQAQLALGAGVVAAVGSVAPLVGGVISGAVVGAAGVGGVIGGLAIAARHPAVQAAAKATGETFAQTMERSGASFVPVTLAALGKVRSEVIDMGDDFERIFAKSSRFVEPLTKGVLGFVHNALPGLEAAIDRGSPIINELASWGPKLGTLVSDTFAKFAAHADEGARALAAFFTVFKAGVDFVVDGIVVLTTTFGVMEKLSAALRGDIVKLMELAAAEEIAEQEGGSFAETLKELVGGLGGVGTTASVATQEIESLAEMVDRLTGENISAERSNIRLEEAIDAATEAGKRNNDGIDANTKKGRDNRGLLLDLADAAKANAADILKMTGSTELASVATEKGRAAFLKAAGAMGVEKTEAIALANKLFGLPDDVTTTAHFNPDNTGVKRWKETLSGIPRKIFISAKFDLINDREVAMALRLGRLSAGGPVIGPGPKGVDSRPYLLAPGEHVLTAREVDAAGGHKSIERWRKSLTGGGGERMATSVLARPAMASGGGGNSFHITVQVPPAANTAEVGRVTVEAIRAYEHNNGRGWRS